MKPAPTIYRIFDASKPFVSSIVFIDGEWVPMRPVGFCGLALSMRIKAAWRVFTGELDAIKWPGGQ